MKTAMATVILFAMMSAVLSCKDDGTSPPDVPERIKLILIDVSVKETFIHVTVSNPVSNETLALQRNGTNVMVFAAVADTSIADTALTQTTTYQYTATVQDANTTGKSNTISAQTLAPTSHNFTWQTFLLGDGNNSSLSDVAIINDTLIYVVGEMYLRDSTGVIEDTPYNLARWNGQRWEIERVTVSTRFGLIVLPFESIFAFSPTDIWVGAGSPIHWDGQRWTYIDIRVILNNNNLDVSKAWGTSSSNMYFVGRGGNIIHFDGINWQKLESGTTIPITDAWGVINRLTGRDEVYCPVTDFFSPGGKKILRIIDRTRVDSVRWDTGRDLSSVWTAKGVPIFTTGDGIFDNKRGIWNEIILGTSVYTNKIRGEHLNDIFLVGSFGLLAHYNGLEWHVNSEVYDATYSGLSVRDGIVAAVGERNSRGVLTLGRRF